MKTQIYRVVFSSNLSNSLLPGYKNGYTAYDQNGFAWAIYNQPGDHVILEKLVRSESATGACMKMLKWQQNGYPESWLLNEFSEDVEAVEQNTTNQGVSFEKQNDSH